MQDHIFRKYDIRGIVSKDLFIEDVYAFGRGLAAYFLQRNPALKHIVVAMDGRSHSSKIKDELTRAICESGLDVLFCGICPTPVFYFAMYKQHEHAQQTVCPGVMITASHNGKEYNGFKICYGKNLISADEIIGIRDMYKKNKTISSEIKGQEKALNIIPDYISWFEQAFAALKNSTISAVIDCGNGAAAAIIPELVRRMQWHNVTVLYETIDGEFPHRSPDPTKPGALLEMAQKLAAKNESACGVAFDGDADRCCMAHEGTVLTGDSLLALFAQAMSQKNKNFSVVFDGKCSQVLSSSLDEWGIRYDRTPTGHASVKAKMVEVGALLGGELSNHFMFCDRYFGYDDGIYAMMRLFEILQETGESLSTLYERFPKSFTTGEVRIPCQENKKPEIVQQVHAAFLARPDARMSMLDGVRVDTEYGWGIVRASNTEPVISFSCESMTQDGFERIKKDFMDILDKVI